MSDRLSLAVRFIVARKRSKCGYCSQPIEPGTLIGKLIRPDQWIHDKCVEQLRDELDAEKHPDRSPRREERSS